MAERNLFNALVVDDEEMVREITSLLIEENGGSAIPASNGEEALELFRINKESLDLVFLDFSMPGKNGYEIFCELFLIDPSICYLMASGLPITPEVNSRVQQGEIDFISKPFSEQELMTAIRRALKKRSITI